MSIQKLTNFTFRFGTHKLVHNLTVFEQLHGRQASDSGRSNQFLLLIGIDLGQNKSAFIFFCQFDQQRDKSLTGLAPVCPEVHQHRLVL